MLEKKTSNGRNNSKLMRDIPVTVSECRPLELVLVTTGDNLRNGKFVPSKKRYRENFKRSNKFCDSALQT